MKSYSEIDIFKLPMSFNFTKILPETKDKILCVM